MGWRKRSLIEDPGGPGGPLVDINLETTGQLDEDRVSADPVIAGESITQGDPIYLDPSTGKWKKSKASDPTTMPARAIATQAAILDGTLVPAYTEQKVSGYVFLAVDRGKSIYVASAGGVTLVPPSATGDRQQRIGFIFSTTEIRVLIDELAVEIV